MDDEERMEQRRENWKHVDRDGLLRVMLQDEEEMTNLKTGFQGACWCCEPVGELNLKLNAANTNLLLNNAELVARLEAVEGKNERLIRYVQSDPHWFEDSELADICGYRAAIQGDGDANLIERLREQGNSIFPKRKQENLCDEAADRITDLEALTSGTCEKHPHLRVPVGCICHYCLDEERRQRITELEEMNTAAEMLVRQTRKRITELEASTRKSIVTFNEYQEEMEALCTSYTARLKLAESYVPSFDWKMYQQAKAAIKGDGDG